MVANSGIFLTAIIIDSQPDRESGSIFVVFHQGRNESANMMNEFSGNP
jgi:hypothetical protein